MTGLFDLIKLKKNILSQSCINGCQILLTPTSYMKKIKEVRIKEERNIDANEVLGCY